jgi:hypothetical protein
MALIRYCEDLEGDKSELSKKTTLDISIMLDRHNLNFDMGKLLYNLVDKYNTDFRVTQSCFLYSFDTDN